MYIMYVLYTILPSYTHVGLLWFVHHSMFDVSSYCRGAIVLLLSLCLYCTSVFQGDLGVGDYIQFTGIDILHIYMCIHYAATLFCIYLEPFIRWIDSVGCWISQ